MLYTINLSQDRSKKSNYLSQTLLDTIKTTLEKKEKTILYINKRGAFSSVVCQDCSYLFECPNCDTSLSVHHHPQRLLCHLCGTQQPLALSCKKCHGNNIKHVGIGTQQIEQSLCELFPEISIYRFDSDNVSTKTEKKEALHKLTQADIIIGTKMITTGFDFQNVGCIGVILLEQELSFPQYNIEEKVYTNIKQLLGRGDRKGQETTFVLQTFIPENPFIKILTSGNYKDFLKYTLEERKFFHYPPFTEIHFLEYRDSYQEKARNFITLLHNKLTLSEKAKQYDIQLVNTPFKRNNQYHYKIIIRGENIREFLTEIEHEILRNSKLSLIAG